jgi:hypothetical protein
LDLGELELGNIAIEKALLVDIDYTFVRDDPGVEIEIKPEDEKKIPDKERPEAFAEE